MGIEPTLVAWEATVLPLNYARIVCDDCSLHRQNAAENCDGQSAPKVHLRNGTTFPERSEGSVG